VSTALCGLVVQPGTSVSGEGPGVVRPKLADMENPASKQNLEARPTKHLRTSAAELSTPGLGGCASLTGPVPGSSPTRRALTRSISSVKFRRLVSVLRVYAQGSRAVPPVRDFGSHLLKQPTTSP
jgi:hypothetical protein